VNNIELSYGINCYRYYF